MNDYITAVALVLMGAVSGGGLAASLVKPDAVDVPTISAEEMDVLVASVRPHAEAFYGGVCAKTTGEQGRTESYICGELEGAYERNLAAIDVLERLGNSGVVAWEAEQ